VSADAVGIVELRVMMRDTEDWEEGAIMSQRGDVVVGEEEAVGIEACGEMRMPEWGEDLPNVSLECEGNGTGID
jgi:hypothetical protein